MRRINISLLFASILGMMQSATAQTPPAYDAAWGTPISSKSDEFNSGTIDATKWWDGGSSYFNDWAAEINKNTNLILTGTTLKIKADSLHAASQLRAFSKWHNPQTASNVYYSYQGATLRSQPTYKYGYLEISAKFPSGNYPFWPAFWLWKDNCTTSPYWYNEIDIAENGGLNSYNGYKMGTNVHLGNSGSCTNDTDNGKDINLSFLISAAEHKYAIEWTPDRIVWYIDDTPVRTLYNASGAGIPQNGMYAVLNFAVDPWHTKLNLTDWNTVGQNQSQVGRLNTPQYFEINYFRYYELSKECGTNLTISTPSDYNRSIKNTITTNTSTPPTFNPSTPAGSYTLRADESVTLDAGTYINPTGTGYFAIDIVACPQ